MEKKKRLGQMANNRLGLILHHERDKWAVSYGVKSEGEEENPSFRSGSFKTIDKPNISRMVALLLKN